MCSSLCQPCIVLLNSLKLLGDGEANGVNGACSTSLSSVDFSKYHGPVPKKPLMISIHPLA
jgi:hypothetical protein